MNNLETVLNTPDHLLEVVLVDKEIVEEKIKDISTGPMNCEDIGSTNSSGGTCCCAQWTQDAGCVSFLPSDGCI